MSDIALNSRGNEHSFGNFKTYYRKIYINVSVPHSIRVN